MSSTARGWPRRLPALQFGIDVEVAEVIHMPTVRDILSHKGPTLPPSIEAERWSKQRSR